MATHTNLSSLFTDIADAIRAKTGKTETIVADNFPAEIAVIETGDNMVSVTYSLGSGTLLYFDEDNQMKTGSGGPWTVNVNSGIVFVYYANTGATLTCSGDYIVAIDRLHQSVLYNCALVKFLSDGGTITVTGGDDLGGN